MNGYDPDDPRPAYLRVADEIRGQIEQGAFSPGDQLPTHRALATRHKVAIETVKRALGIIRTEGLIVSRQGKGSYVSHGTIGESNTEPNATDLADQLARLGREMDIVKRRLTKLEADASTRNA